MMTGNKTRPTVASGEASHKRKIRTLPWRLVLITSMFLSGAYNAQQKLLLAGGVSQCRPQPLLTDPGGQIIVGKGPDLMLNIDLRMRLRDIWFAETGIIMKGPGDGFGFRHHFSGRGGNAPHLVVPLRLAPAIYIIKERLFCSPLFGMCLGINTNYGSTGVGSGFLGRGDPTDSLAGVRWQEKEDHRFSSTFLLFQIGLSADFVFENHSAIQLRSGYYLGKRTLSNTDIQYQLDGGPVYQASLVSHGTFWQVLGISFVYPLGRKQAEDDPGD